MLALASVTGGACGLDEALGLPGASPDDGTTGSSTGPGAADFGTGNTFLPDTEGVDILTGSGTADESGGGGGQSAAQIYAVARCSALLSCPCPIMPFADQTECENSMANQFVGAQNLFATAATDFDCFDTIVAFYEASACETTLEVASMELAPACNAFSDEGALDEPCVRIGSTAVHAHSCAEGLTCTVTIDGPRCVTIGDTSHVLAAGQTCVGEAGIAGPCEGGHFCDAQSQTCVLRFPVDTPCSSHGQCSTGYCDSGVDPAVCRDKLGAGSACTTTTACASPLCEDGACERPLCADGQCQQGVPQVCFSEDL